MRIKVPEYFTDFKCIADKCTDSCCIGWEIVIDSEAKEKYSSLESDFGREIVKKTQHGYFPLSENGRCAFLSENGLCRIISTLGEGYLCDICREHPRYYGISADGIEGGLGLGCEEAARLILNSGGNARFTYVKHAPKYFSEDEYAQVTDEIRDTIYTKINELDIEHLTAFLEEIALLGDEIAFAVCCGIEIPEIPNVFFKQLKSELFISTFHSFLDILSECESLTADWADLAVKAKEVKISDLKSKEKELKSLIFYFTHRYIRECVEQMTLGQRILFSLYSAYAIIALSKIIEADDPIMRAAVLFSKNIEYSTDNIDAILDRLTDFL